MRVLVVVPTTGGPLVIHSLRARAALPVSCAFAQGDYRPLPWSTDYARLTGPQGPIAAALASGKPLPAYELRLSGSFDAGRSWEVPVTIAHLLVANGHEIVAQPNDAELIIWATGAVDLDLQVIESDYSLCAKIEASRSLIAEAAPARILCVLPPDPHLQDAKSLAALAFPAPQVLPTKSLTGLQPFLAGLAAPNTASEATRVAPKQRLRPAILGSVAAVLALIGGAAVTVPRLRQTIPSAPVPAVNTKPPETAGPAPPEPVPSQTAASPAKTEPTPAKLEPVTAIGASSSALLTAEEIRAPAGASCRNVLFGSARGERYPIVAMTSERLTDSQLAQNLCGLAFHTAIAGASIEIGAELTPLVVPGPAADLNGGKTVFLRDNIRQNVAYSVHLYKQDGSNRRLLVSVAHELVKAAP
jgi:hypothetical protein